MKKLLGMALSLVIAATFTMGPAVAEDAEKAEKAEKSEKKAKAGAVAKETITGTVKVTKDEKTKKNVITIDADGTEYTVNNPAPAKLIKLDGKKVEVTGNVKEDKEGNKRITVLPAKIKEIKEEGEEGAKEGEKKDDKAAEEKGEKKKEKKKESAE